MLNANILIEEYKAHLHVMASRETLKACNRSPTRFAAL